VAGGVRAADPDSFLIPVEVRPHVGGGVTERQTATAAVGKICFRAVQQQIGMERRLAGIQDVIHEVAILLDVLNCLIQHIVFFRIARPECHRAMMMRPGDESHAGVLHVRIVNRQPACCRLRRRQRPITRILMPRHLLAIPRHLAEEMRSPADDILADEVFHARDNFLIREDVPHAAILEMSRADGITIAPRRDDLREEIVEIPPNRGDVVVGVNPNPLDVPFPIELLDLFRRQHLRPRIHRRMKLQIPRQRRQIRLIKNGFEFGFHGEVNLTANKLAAQAENDKGMTTRIKSSCFDFNLGGLRKHFWMV